MGFLGRWRHPSWRWDPGDRRWRGGVLSNALSSFVVLSSAATGYMDRLDYVSMAAMELVYIEGLESQHGSVRAGHNGTLRVITTSTKLAKLSKLRPLTNLDAPLCHVHNQVLRIAA